MDTKQIKKEINKEVRYNHGLFIFRRDLRVVGNTGLYALSSLCDKISCVFILDKKQVSPVLNKYFSMNAVMFMLDCLEDLKDRIELSVLTGDVFEVVS